MTLGLHHADVLTLLSLDGEAFVRQAYRSLLGRAADAEGQRSLLTRLQAGVSKEQILAELQISPEGRLAARRRGYHASAPVQFVARTGRGAEPANVQHVNDLLQLPDDEAFLRSAYVSILGRPIDALGLVQHAQMLREGWSRCHVVCGLHGSPEGRQARTSLNGLQQMAARYAEAQRRSWSGWYWRNVKGVESDLPRDRQLRAVYRAVTAGAA